MIAATPASPGDDDNKDGESAFTNAVGEVSARCRFAATPSRERIPAARCAGILCLRLHIRRRRGSRSIPEQWLSRPRRRTVSICAACWSPTNIMPKIWSRRRCSPRSKGGGVTLPPLPSEPGSSRILRHKAIDERRRDRRHDQYLADVDPVVEGNFNRLGKWRKPPSGWTPNPQSLVESQEFWAIFHSCMRALPARMREAFALRVVEGLDASETCRILDITSANLWTLLYRARERLRRCLEGKWFTQEER